MLIQLSRKYVRKRFLGAALVDTIVAIGLLSLALTSIFAGVRTGFSHIEATEEAMRATQILVEKMESIRLYNWDQINSNGFLPSSFEVPYNPEDGTEGLMYHGTLLLTNAQFTRNYSDKLKQVTVELEWDSDFTTHKRSCTTLISQHGMQDYID